MAESTAMVSTEGMSLVESVLATGRELTSKEVEILSNAYVTCNIIGHWLLLALFEGKAHKTTEHKDFATFAQKRLGIHMSDRTIDNYLCRARVERNIGEKMQNLHFSKPQVGLEAATELNKLPPSEQWEAWKEVSALKGYGTHLPKQVARSLRDIVIRRLNLTAKALPAAPIAPVSTEPARPKPNMNPIVPPTYDRGPEHDEDIEEPEEEETDGPLVPVVTDQAVSAPARVFTPAIPLVQSKVSEQDPMRCAAVAFMREYVAAYKTNDRNAFDELFRDAVKFLKEYGTP